MKDTILIFEQQNIIDRKFERLISSKTLNLINGVILIS
jgi:hypothetical protein